MAWKRASGGAHAIQAATVPKPQPPPPGEEPPPGGDQGGGANGASPAPPAASSPSLPDNSFRISTVIRNLRKGTATLAVVVPGPGELTLRGAALRRRQATAPAQVLLPVVPKPAQRRALRRKGALRLRLTVTFAPTAGEAASRTLALRLRKASRQR